MSLSLGQGTRKVPRNYAEFCTLTLVFKPKRISFGFNLHVSFTPLIIPACSSNFGSDCINHRVL